MKRAVAVKPDSAEAYLFLGYAHDRLGDRQAALEAWRIADRLDEPGGRISQNARQAIGSPAPRP